MHPNVLKSFLEGRNAFWHWDNHKHLAELTSGKISDFFANLTPIFSEPGFQDEVGKGLGDLIFWSDAWRGVDMPLPSKRWVVGSAMGAIGLAQSLAKTIGAKAAYTESKIVFDDATCTTSTKYMELNRFDLGPKPYVFLVEDVTTTGGTTAKTVAGIKQKHPDVEFFPYIATVLNRSGSELAIGNLLGQKYISIMDVKPNVWDSVGDLPDHLRHCEPIRPKGNWKQLNEKFGTKQEIPEAWGQ